MEQNRGLTDLIYEYYESRILFGIYRYGERLSSVPQICAAFRLGLNTVLSALDKLEKNGYIETEERKTARVIYQGSEEVFRENAAKYFVPRKEGIIDFQYAGEFLFLPMWKIGTPVVELDVLNSAFGNGKNKGKVTISPPVKLYFDILRVFDNELLINLYWQCLRYLKFLYPQRNEKRPVYAVEGRLSQEQINDMKQDFDDYFTSMQDEVLDFIETAREEYHLENVKQIPFSWIICRRRPQVRYTLASEIIREILWEDYPVDSYLPSLPKMAERYGVSLSTVRRTLDVLNSLGVTRTYMGIGTKVCLEPVDIKILEIPEIRENLKMHGEGMQILALTVSGVTLFTLEAAEEKKKGEFLQRIRQLHGKTSSILCIDVLLSFISSECPSSIIRECYEKLRELAAWGYIFSAVMMENGELNSSLDEFIALLEEDLQKGDLPAFAGRWQSFIDNRLKYFYAKLSFRKK